MKSIVSLSVIAIVGAGCAPLEEGTFTSKVKLITRHVAATDLLFPPDVDLLCNDQAKKIVWVAFRCLDCDIPERLAEIPKEVIGQLRPGPSVECEYRGTVSLNSFNANSDPWDFLALYENSWVTECTPEELFLNDEQGQAPTGSVVFTHGQDGCDIE